ncbi:MAG: lantibiotic dehydratase, partial [Pseudonocardiaceae bacterium]
MARKDRPLYRCADTALVRTAAHAELALPICPDLTDGATANIQQCRSWLRAVWALNVVAGAVEHASPALARQVKEVCAAKNPDAQQARRTVLSVLRYLLRLQHRATPFGMFAGVAPASFDAKLAVRWGAQHRALTRADASWIADVITRLESCPHLLARLPLMTNNLAFVRGDRLVVPYPPWTRDETITPAEVSLRYTSTVRMAVEAARSPIRCAELSLCRQQFGVYLRARPLSGQVAKHALEPVINLARLMIRIGDGEGAYLLLDTLYQAVRSRTTSVIDGRRVPFNEFTVSDADHRTLCQWLWAVLLADGTRALAGLGRWDRALAHVEKHGGVGERLLDGRQVAILAHWSAGDSDSALSVLDDGTASEPWEHAVAACLTVLCHGGSGLRPTDSAVTAMVEHYLALEAEPPFLVFRVRLGLTMIRLA